MGREEDGRPGVGGGGGHSEMRRSAGRGQGGGGRQDSVIPTTAGGWRLRSRDLRREGHVIHLLASPSH